MALVSIALATMALTIPWPVENQDFWLHLCAGRYIVETGWVRLTDPFRYNASQHEYLVPAWLTSVLYLLIFRTAGGAGIITLRTLLVSATYALVIATARRLGARWAMIVLLMPLFLYAFTTRITDRPHLFGPLFLASDLYLFARYRMNGRWLFAIPLLQLVWINMHGSHVEGLALVVIWAVGEACLWARARYWGIGPTHALPRARVLQIAALVPACIAASCLTPYGYKLLTFPVYMASQRWIMTTITEYWPV